MNTAEFGRCGHRDGSTVLFWSGSAVEIKVKSKDLYVIIEAEYDTYEIMADFIIDGERSQKLVLNKGIHRYTVFRGFDDSKETVVRIVRDTQSMPEDTVSYAAVRGFDMDGDLLEAPQYDMNLEFIGDSITSGEGCGLTNREEWVSAVFDATNAYPYITAKKLNAKYSVISQSGWGVYSSWDGNTAMAIPDHYDKVCATLKDKISEMAGAQKTWDFSADKKDAVIINLGTNDSNARKLSDLSEEEYRSRFIDKACGFLENVRSKNPESLIIWAYGMLGNDMETYITNAVQKYKEASGDKKIMYLSLENTRTEWLGVRQHPDPDAHEYAAETIAQFILKNIR